METRKRTKEELIAAQREARAIPEHVARAADVVASDLASGEGSYATRWLADLAGSQWARRGLRDFDLRRVDEQGRFIDGGWLALPSAPNARKCLALTAPSVQCQEPATHKGHDVEGQRCFAHAPEHYAPMMGACLTWEAGEHLDDVLRAGAERVTARARAALEPVEKSANVATYDRISYLAAQEASLQVTTASGRVVDLRDPANIRPGMVFQSQHWTHPDIRDGRLTTLKPGRDGGDGWMSTTGNVCFAPTTAERFLGCDPAVASAEDVAEFGSVHTQEALDAVAKDFGTEPTSLDELRKRPILTVSGGRLSEEAARKIAEVFEGVRRGEYHRMVVLARDPEQKGLLIAKLDPQGAAPIGVENAPAAGGNLLNSDAGAAPPIATFADLLAAERPALVCVLEPDHSRCVLKVARVAGEDRFAFGPVTVWVAHDPRQTLGWPRGVDVAVGFNETAARRLLDGSSLCLAVAPEDAQRFWGMA